MDTPTGALAADLIREAAEARKAGGEPGASNGKRESRANPRNSPPADQPPEDDAPAKQPLTPKFKVLHAAVLEIYTAAQMAAFMFDPFASEQIRLTKEACTDAWIDLARQDPKVERMLKRLTTGSAWGGVIMAHASLVIPIMASRGIMPGGALFGGAAMNAMPDTEAQQEPLFNVPDPFTEQGYVPAA